MTYRTCFASTYPCFVVIDSFINGQCSKVKTPFSKSEEQEIDLAKDAVVFVKTIPVNGWVYVEALDGSHGYAPFDHLTPVLPLVGKDRVSYRPSDSVLPRSSTQELENVVRVARRSPNVSNQSKHTTYSISVFPNRSEGEPKDTDASTLRRRKNPRLSLSIQNSQPDNICRFRRRV